MDIKIIIIAYIITALLTGFVISLNLTSKKETQFVNTVSHITNTIGFGIMIYIVSIVLSLALVIVVTILTPASSVTDPMLQILTQQSQTDIAEKGLRFNDFVLLFIFIQLIVAIRYTIKKRKG